MAYHIIGYLKLSYLRFTSQHLNQDLQLAYREIAWKDLSGFLKAH